MRYTTTDGPKKPLNAIQEGSLGDKMGIAGYFYWFVHWLPRNRALMPASAGLFAALPTFSNR